MYVLMIVTVLASGAQTVTMHDFDSKTSCSSALLKLAMMKSDRADKYVPREQERPLFVMECTPK